MGRRGDFRGEMISLRAPWAGLIPHRGEEERECPPPTLITNSDKLKKTR